MLLTISFYLNFKNIQESETEKRKKRRTERAVQRRASRWCRIFSYLTEEEVCNSWAWTQTDPIGERLGSPCPRGGRQASHHPNEVHFLIQYNFPSFNFNLSTCKWQALVLNSQENLKKKLKDCNERQTCIFIFNKLNNIQHIASVHILRGVGSCIYVQSIYKSSFLRKGKITRSYDHVQHLVEKLELCCYAQHLPSTSIYK